MAITTTGYGSGLPISDLVSQLVSAEGSPTLSRLDQKEASLQAELSAISILKGALSSFQASFAKLQDAGNFTSRAPSSSDSAIATMTAEESASLGSYSLEVSQLATAHKLVAQQGYTAGDTGNLSFTNAAGDSFSIDIDTDNATLEGVRDAINEAADNVGVTATILNLASGPRLVLTANDTGEENRITSISSTSTSGDLSGFDYSYVSNADPLQDGDTANYDQVRAAADAAFTLEGQALTSASNVVDSVIPGVTLTLKDTTETDKPVALTVGTNTASIKSVIEGFVKSYNSLQSLISEQTRYNAETGQAGTLQGDALTRTVQSQLRGMISGSYSAGGSITSLLDLGMTTNSDGTLKLDSDKLKTALADNFTDVTAFFSSENGLANRLNTNLQGYLQSDGTFDSRTESINTRMAKIDDDRESLDIRLSALEARLLSQFNAMDAMVAQLSSTGDFLTQQLENISQISNYSKK
ncbi:flagellar filament capping protein FliD [Marinobacterium rhizophilum]|uniref:flagellar filament capping protein FliD n=1 Tax=Marinobacterium rhizophilum TaxID=420402 RepID=UPI000369AFF2|nr:flagellar filament capping protein FliD [Marinobacterium rhizophilum]